MKKIIILVFLIIAVCILIKGNLIENNSTKPTEQYNISGYENRTTEMTTIKILIDEPYETTDLEMELSRRLEEELSVPTPTPTVTSPSTSKPKNEVKQTDLEMLARIIYCEAGGEHEQDQLAVGQVVLNRMKEFNLTLKQTIYQKNSSGIYVFSPVASSSYSTRKFSNESKEIASRLLEGEKYEPVGNALYFCTIAAYNRKGWHYQYVVYGKGVITLKTQSTVYIR